jgi:hypothetical protein
MRSHARILARGTHGRSLRLRVVVLITVSVLLLTGMVATDTAWTRAWPDQTVTKDGGPGGGPPPGQPVLGRTEQVKPIRGKIFVILNGTLVPLSTTAGLTTGTTIDALHGTLQLTTATGKGLTTQTGTFGGAVFKATQTRSGPLKGLTTLTLVNNAFKGAPSFASCTAQSGTGASAAAVSSKVLQLLHAKDNHGKFRTKGRYAAATTRGTVWSIADRCDGTVTHVNQGSVVVNDLVRHKSITVHAGGSYLAKASK